ncbi:MAG TPA: zinc-ribbon domain-containing protein [Candidatus Latescibacteria bacterium]|nr:zinc-ribbon domain-containing protein [Candidatus Latescibacterota bacterium]
MLAALVVFVMALAVGAYVGYPLLFPGRNRQEEDPERHEFELRGAQLAGALRELETDHSLGKVADDDFAERHARLARELESVEQRLAGAEPSDQTDVDELAERLVTARRAARKRARSGLCPGCGQSNPPAARFCMNCGSRLEEREPTS